MPAFWVSMVLLFIFFLLEHPWYRRLSLAGALGFTTLYSVRIVIAFRLNPEAAAQWSAQTLAGWQILGVPVEEFAWAFGYGAVFPMLLAFAYRTRLQLVPSPDRST